REDVGRGLWRRIQKPAVLPNAFDKRTAISGETAALPFRTRERVVRVTPKAAAPSVTFSLSPSRHSLTISPGWQGSFIGMVFLSSDNPLNARHRPCLVQTGR